MTATATGSSRPPAVKVENHAPPTDPDVLHGTRVQQADAAVASAEAKVERQEQHVAVTSGAKKKRQSEHLKAAKEALAEAIAARKELD